MAVNKEIRWGDLVYLKQVWEKKAGGTRVKREDSTSSFSIYDDAQPSVEGGQGYRVSARVCVFNCSRSHTDSVCRS